MIVRFRHKGLRRLYEKGDRRFVPAQRVSKIERILARLDVAGEPADMNLPGFQLHLAARQPGRVLGRQRFGELANHLPLRGGERPRRGTWWTTTRHRRSEGVRDGYAQPAPPRARQFAMTVWSRWG